ncbi:PTS sugar transporter subunit IIB [Lacticaseibacillus daqingensis]|uniref:PTS sugar transporter subunit IIB n=1 Tax=Lacticaseibacillus daqingensis TaxID=2486014 RepID=UPI000F777BB5|nr:PTS sugar transporter subunit IIB [Lacticaseibacillus daqingensis]
MIELVRADDRLVHGLVAVSWTNALQPSILLVANDAAASNHLQQMTMKMAKPAGVTMAIKNLADAATILNNSKYATRRIFVVTANIADALTLSRVVPDIKKVNVGTAGIHYATDQAVAITAGVKMTIDEFTAASALNAAGIEVFAETAPSQERVGFAGIKKAFSH